MYRELKHAVLSRYMLTAVVLAAAILCYAYIQNQAGWKTADVLSLIALPMALSGFTPFASIFPCLPYSLRFVEEYNTGYIRFVLLRKSRRQYLIQKALITAGTGGLMMLAAFAAVFAVALWIGLSTETDSSGFYLVSPWYNLLPVWGGKMVLLLKLGLAFLFGCTWSLVCLLISVVFCNRYVAFLGTFLIYQSLWQLLPGSIFNPVYLLRGDYGGYVSFWVPALLQTAAILLLVVLFLVLGERKIQNV